MIVRGPAIRSSALSCSLFGQLFSICRGSYDPFLLVVGDTFEVLLLRR